MSRFSPAGVSELLQRLGSESYMGDRRRRQPCPADGKGGDGGSAQSASALFAPGYSMHSTHSKAQTQTRWLHTVLCCSTPYPAFQSASGSSLGLLPAQKRTSREGGPSSPSRRWTAWRPFESLHQPCLGLDAMAPSNLVMLVATLRLHCNAISFSACFHEGKKSLYQDEAQMLCTHHPHR